MGGLRPELAVFLFLRSGESRGSGDTNDSDDSGESGKSGESGESGESDESGESGEFLNTSIRKYFSVHHLVKL